MKRYLVQEEYREDVKGVRVVLVEAESKEAVIEDGDYEVLDIVEELDASDRGEGGFGSTDQEFPTRIWKK